MDFADEHYVKLFTRDTVTWRSWPWQARALLPLLMRKVDNAGFFDVGKREPARSLAIMVELPLEVVAPGLDALLEDGTAELVDGRLLLPNFVDAQESKKTDKAKARDYRNRKKDHARAKASKTQEGTVTARHQASPLVTAGDPPALPCPSPSPAQEEDLRRTEPQKPQRGPRKPSAAENFFAWLGATRAAKTPLSDAPISPSAINKLFGAALTQHGRPACERAYVAFLALPEPAAMDPPWPWQSFNARLPKLVADAAKGGASSTSKFLTAEQRKDLYADTPRH